MIRPRKLIHHGVVEAGGFLFDLRLISEQQMRARVLGLWEPGSRLYSSSGSTVLVMPAPRSVRTARAPGLPLVLRHGALLAVPLDDDEFGALAPPGGTLVLVRGGEAVAEPLDSWIAVNPALWLDLEGYEMMNAESLGHPPAPAADALAPVTFQGRTLKGVPPADPQMEKVLAALHGEADGGQSIWERRGQKLMARISRWLAAPVRQPEGSGRIPSQLPGNVAKPPMSRKIRSALLKALWESKLGRLMAVPHARYLNRMMSLFDNGDIIDALRHAIPLGGRQGENASPPGFIPPNPRTDLRLDPIAARNVRASLSLPPELMQELRTRYRRAAIQLAERGMITEAAFVIADLLHETEEAVAFLEKHGQHRLAAELAEGRDLPPQIVIRQWILAGDHDRAVKIARRTGAYATAIQSLERSHPEKAEILRLLMADALATAGEYGAAADVIWPIADSRHLAVAWLDRAIEGGGATGARMLARRLALSDIPHDTLYERALALLDSGDVEEARIRIAFARQLYAEAPNAATRTLARAAIRSLARDAALGSPEVTSALLNELLTLADDGGLRADLPALPSAGRTEDLARRSTPLEITIAQEESGIGPVYDAALLPNGKLAVALGEAGVQLLSRDGRVTAHFQQPAARLVLSDNGDRAIAIAPRGETVRLSRIDFIARRAESWCQARIDSWGESFDGSSWLVGTGNEVLVIDAIATEFQALWRWRDVGTGVEAIARNGHHGAFLVSAMQKDAWGNPVPRHDSAQAPSYEVWLVDLKSHTLRSRTEKPAPGPAGFYLSPRGLSPLGSIADVVVIASPFSSAETEMMLAVMIDNHQAELMLGGGEYHPLRLEHGEAWSIALFSMPQGVKAFLIGRADRTVRAIVTLHGASHAISRLSPETLLLADNCGRIIVLDLHTGAILRDLRLR